ncbi:MAG: ABC transporter permease, partial [Burkholderiales bacterium]|nr:ABC transporter permease [Burkholderiales bacterium]
MALDANPNPTASASALSGFFAGDVWHSFRSSPVAMLAAVISLVCLVCALFAEVVAPHNPFDLATLELMDSLKPPAWVSGGEPKYLLGTDGQGRDILSALMYGTRISLLVGLASVLLSILIGVSLGLLAGFVGGRVDAFIMRICDVMLSFPSILVAL